MPRFLRTKYQQYKRDTFELATWLSRAAIHYGYSVTKFRPSEVPLEAEDEKRTEQQFKKAKKKKKKAKAKAKNGKGESGQGDEEGDAGDGQDQHGEAAQYSGDYVLDIPQYLEITRFLVDKGVTIPIELMKLFRRCITLRERSLKTFLPNPDQSTPGHKHFISVLREAEDILLRYLGKNTQTTNRVALAQPVESADKETASKFGNRYGALAEGMLEEEEDEAESMPDVSLPAPPRPPRYNVSTERMVFGTLLDIEEGLTAIQTFYEDIHSVRRYIVDLWTDYKDGLVDLITAAVTTNTALELLRGPHDDLLTRVLPTFGDDMPLAVASLLHLVYPDRGYLEQPAPIFTQVDPTDTKLAFMYDYLLFPNLQILGGMSDLFVDGTIPVYKPGHFGQFNPNLKFNSLPFGQRWHQSQILLCESFIDYITLVDSASDGSTFQKNNLYFIDEIAYQLDAFSRTREPTLLLMVVSQVFVDIVLTTGPASKRGLKTLQSTAGAMAKSLSARANIEGPVHPDSWPAQYEAMARELRDEAGFWSKIDPADAVRQALVKMGAVDRAAQDKSSLMERNPMLCGLLLFRLQLKYQRLGFTLANSFGTILYASHLFVACQRAGVPPGHRGIAPWADMDLVMDMHGAEDIFGGKTPTTIDDSYTSYLVMMGASTSALSTTRHVFTNEMPKYIANNRRLFISRDRAKGLKDHTQILPIFADKYTVNARWGTHLDITSIETLLSDLGAGVSVLGANVKSLPLRRKRTHKSAKFSVVQLLSVLEQGLLSETTSLRFDYVSMHLRCIRVLQAVRASCDSYFTGKLGPDYLKGDHQLPAITGLILHWATMSGRAAEQVGMVRDRHKRSEGVFSKVLVGAAEAIGDFLRETKEGGAEKKKIQDRKQ